MNFSIDYDKVGDIGKYYIDKGGEIDNIYSDLIDLCLAIDENWKSEDSSVYIGKMIDFLKDIIDDLNEVFETGKLLNNLSVTYSDKDNKWEKDLLREEQEKNE